MKNIREIILIILLIISIVLATIVIALRFVYKKSYFEKLDNIDSTIESINELNKNFIGDNLSNNNSYIQNDNYTCFEYIGENTDEYIAKIEQLYIHPFREYGLFNLVNANIEGKEIRKLYVCLEQNCKISNIDSYEIINEDEETRIVSIGNQELVMYKVDNIWKFVSPVILCDK